MNTTPGQVPETQRTCLYLSRVTVMFAKTSTSSTQTGDQGYVGMHCNLYTSNDQVEPIPALNLFVEPISGLYYYRSSDKCLVIVIYPDHVIQ